VKLISKQRIGARIVRRYDAAQTPLDRLLATSALAAQLKQELCNQRAALDPFLLAAQIEVKLATQELIWSCRDQLTRCLIFLSAIERRACLLGRRNMDWPSRCVL